MIQVFDNFIDDPERVRQSAIRSGFGTWNPNKGDIGANFYEGVNFWGDHATLFRALHKKIGTIIPSSMFFRINNPKHVQHSLIHSDRDYGEHTAIVYLSPTSCERSGTAFYKHRETGWTDRPPLEELIKDPEFLAKYKQQERAADDRDWQMYRFVEAKYNRCLVFDAPKIHCRIPKLGYGTTENDSRMVWVCHFNAG
jgi:hypothetical protein